MKNISVYNVVLPNRPLSNIELLDAVKKIEIPGFRGVFVRDNLPSKPGKHESGFIIEFTHRVALHKKYKEKFYFDTYGF